MTIYIQCEDHGNTHIIKWTVDVPEYTQGVLLTQVSDPATRKAVELRVAIADALEIPVTDISYVITGDL